MANRSKVVMLFVSKRFLDSTGRRWLCNLHYSTRGCRLVSMVLTNYLGNKATDSVIGAPLN